MLVLAMRGASGVTGFVRTGRALSRGADWICVGVDRNVFPRPQSIDEVVPVMSALVQHAATHVGAIQQVVELDV